MDLTGIGSALDFGKGLLDRFWPPKATEEEKFKALGGIIPMIQSRDNEIANAKKEIIVAELQQGDNYTKRARPSVVYMGLIFISLVHIVIPLITNVTVLARSELTIEQSRALLEMTRMSLPTEFWVAWGSVVSVWSIGRSAERRGFANKIIEAVTGNKK